MPGAGTTTEQLSYAAVDSNPLPGISYYRLAQTDFDGKSSYSNIVPVSFMSANEPLLLFPNPVNAGGPINLQFNVTTTTEFLLVIYDATGRETYSTTVTATQANGNVQLVTLNTPDKLSAGIYTIVATSLSDNATYRQKVVVQ